MQRKRRKGCCLVNLSLSGPAITYLLFSDNPSVFYRNKTCCFVPLYNWQRSRHDTSIPGKRAVILLKNFWNDLKPNMDILFWYSFHKAFSVTRMRRLTVLIIFPKSITLTLVTAPFFFFFICQVFCTFVTTRTVVYNERRCMVTSTLQFPHLASEQALVCGPSSKTNVVVA